MLTNLGFKPELHQIVLLNIDNALNIIYIENSYQLAATLIVE